MHETSQGLQICALLPDAREVWLVETENGRRIAQLTLEDPRGFFIAQLTRRKKSFRYQFAVTWQENPQIIEDPTVSVPYYRILIAGYWLKVPIYALMNVWGAFNEP